MRLAEPELESFLQLIVHLPCNVATKHPRDLRKPDDRLCQADVRTSEEQVPRLHGRGGAHNFTCQCQGHSISLRSDKDILGQVTLQRLRQGYCHREPLFWGSHGVW